MAFGNFKGLPRRTACDRILRDNALLKIPNMMGIKDVLLQWLIIDIKSTAMRARSPQLREINLMLQVDAAWSDTLATQDKYKSSVMVIHYLSEKLSNSIIRKFEKRKLKSSFKGDIWGTALAGMYLISKYN